MNGLRKWLAGVTIFTLLLSACSQSLPANNVTSVRAEPGPVTLRYSSYLLDSAQAGRVYYEAIAEFEALHPNIKIEPDFIQNTNYTAGIKTRLLGGEPVDVFDTWSASLFNEIRMLDEDIYLDLSDMEVLKDFVPSSLAPVKIDGKVYGVPEIMHSDGLVYNKTLFAQMGLQVPETWEEFVELCELLKREGMIPIAMGSEWWVPQYFFGSILSNNGADRRWTAMLESGEVLASDPKLVDALEKTRLLMTNGYIPDNWTMLKHEQSKDLLGQGKAAMMIAGTWDVPSVMERYPEYEYDFMMVPGEQRTVPNINIGTYRVISSGTKHPEEAKQFVAFMNGRSNQERLAQGALGIPSVKEYELDGPVIEGLAAAVTRKDATLYWPHTVSTESLQVEILEHVNQYMSSGDLEATLKGIQKAIDEARELQQSMQGVRH